MFPDSHIAAIKDLSRNMYLGALLLILVGIFYALSILASKPSQNPPVLAILATAFYVAFGIYTGLAARSFGTIATSRGQELNNLMYALNNLRNMYRLVIISGVIVLVVVAIGLIAAL